MPQTQRSAGQSWGASLLRLWEKGNVRLGYPFCCVSGGLCCWIAGNRGLPLGSAALLEHWPFPSMQRHRGYREPFPGGWMHDPGMALPSGHWQKSRPDWIFTDMENRMLHLLWYGQPGGTVVDVLETRHTMLWKVRFSFMHFLKVVSLSNIWWRCLSCVWSCNINSKFFSHIIYKNSREHNAPLGMIACYADKPFKFWQIKRCTLSPKPWGKTRSESTGAAGGVRCEARPAACQPQALHT